MFPARRVLHRLAHLWVRQPRNARACLLALGLIVASLLAMAGPSKGQGWTATWTHRAEPPRGPKGSVEAIFDTVNARVVLFGSSASESLSEVWQYDSTKDSWAQLESHERCPASFTPPTGRNEYALEYEPINQLFWIFGGSESGCTGQARTAGRGSTTSIIVDPTLTGTTVDFYKDWTVSARGTTVYVSAYNPWSKILYLAAPLSLAPGSQYFLYPQRDGGTFSYSPVTKSWSSLTGPHWKYTGPQPSNRLSPAMAYSTRDTAIVMFGGQGRNDTWVLDAEAKSWVQKIPSQAPGLPPGLAQLKNSFVYDRDNDVFVLFGGCLCTGEVGPSSRDTWAYHLSTNTWTKRTPAVSPPPRQGHNLVYDSTNRVVVLFGGYDAPSLKHYNDLWVYSYTTNTWTQLFPSLSPPGRRAGTMVYDPVRQRTIVYGGQSAWALHDVWALQLQGPSPGNPVPAVTSLSQDSAVAGGPAFTLMVTGANFASSSTARWNGGSRPTTYVRSTQLQASISATDIANTGTAQITVATPAPGGGVSNSLAFAVTRPQPAPTLTSINPTTAAAGGPAVTLTATGTNFAGTSVLQVNGSNRASTVVSSTQLTATVLASDLVTVGTLKISVFTPAPGGGTSVSQILTASAPSPDVSVTAVSPGTFTTTPTTGTAIPSPSPTQTPTTPTPALTVQATYANGTTESVTGIVSNLTPAPTPSLAPSSTSSPAAPQAGATSIDNLRAGEWYQVPNSHLRPVLPNPLPPGNPTEIMTSWSGGAYDTTRDRLIVTGGMGYAGNELYAFDIRTLTWSRIWGPSSNSVIPDSAGGAANPRCYMESYADGNPVARHTYSGLTYIPTLDLFWLGGGARYCTDFPSKAVWTFSFRTNTWRQGTDSPWSAELSMIGIYDPVTQHVFYTTQTAPLSEYDPVANTWTQRASQWGQGALDSGGFNGAIDPRRRKFVAIGGGHVYSWDLNQPGIITRQTLATTGDLGAQNAWYPGFEYDAAADRFVAWAGGTDVYTLNMDTLVWTRVSAAPTNSVTPTPPPGNGTLGRFRYIPSKNAYVLVNSIDEDVFIYKLPSGSATVASSPLAAPAPTPPPSPVSNTAPTPAPLAASTPSTTPSPTPTVTPTVTPTPLLPSGQINIPTGVFVALPLPDKGRGVGPNKHTTWTHNPIDGRLYQMGGDFSTPETDQASYAQAQFSVSIAERWASQSDNNAGWRLEYPYCGSAGGIQPKHPDFIGWTWDVKRNLFWFVPGVMEVSNFNCPAESPSRVSDPAFRMMEVMTFDPFQTDLTKRWKVVTSNVGPNSTDTWRSWHDPVSDTIIRLGYNGGSGGVVDIYNIAANTWSTHNLGPNAVGQEIRVWKEGSALDVQGRVIYTVDGVAGRIFAYHIDTGRMEDLGPVPGGSITLPDGTSSSNDSYLAYDGLHNVVYYWRLNIATGGGSLEIYHPSTKQWESAPMVSSPSGMTAETRHGFVYDPYQNVLVLIGSTNASKPYMFLYRYAN